MVPKEEYNYPLPVQRPSPRGDKFIYIDYVNNEPFYVGMGNWVRVRNPDRNDYHVQMLYNLHRKDRWIRRVVARNLGTSDAFNLEHTLILCYGRKDIGTGILVNKNNGVGIDLRNVSAPRLLASKPWPKAVSCLALFFSVPVLLLFFLVIGAAHKDSTTHSLAPTRDLAVSSSISPVTHPDTSTSPPVPAPTATLAPRVLAVATPTPHIAGTAVEAKWPDGRKLLHPGQFVRTRVVNVEANDTLKLRSGPGTSFKVLAEIPADETDITAFNYDQVWDGDSYRCPVEWKGLRGYVGRSYLPKP
jgi:hypothetical protein